jgi:hypothetical protein
VETQLDSGLEDIRAAEDDVGQWIALADKNGLYWPLGSLTTLNASYR